METGEAIEQQAQRWAKLMKLCGLRGNVFAAGAAGEGEEESGPKSPSMSAGEGSARDASP